MGFNALSQRVFRIVQIELFQTWCVTINDVQYIEKELFMLYNLFSYFPYFCSNFSIFYLYLYFVFKILKFIDTSNDTVT